MYVLYSAEVRLFMLIRPCLVLLFGVACWDNHQVTSPVTKAPCRGRSWDTPGRQSGLPAWQRSSVGRSGPKGWPRSSMGSCNTAVRERNILKRGRSGTLLHFLCLHYVLLAGDIAQYPVSLSKSKDELKNPNVS